MEPEQSDITDEILEMFSIIEDLDEKVISPRPSVRVSEWDSYLEMLAADEASVLPASPPSSIRRKHSRDSPSDEAGSPFFSDTCSEEEDRIKSQRQGSLGRIIANTALVVERTESGSKLPKVNNEALNNLRRETLCQFMSAFSLGDMVGLAALIQENCSESCFLSTPDLMEPVLGRADIMMLFSLHFENFPDGIYRELPGQSGVMTGPDSICTTYSFTGTQVFDQTMQVLFGQVREHWTSVQAVAPVEGFGRIDSLAYCWVPPGSSAGVSVFSSNISSPRNVAPAAAAPPAPPAAPLSKRQPQLQPKPWLVSALSSVSASFGTVAGRIASRLTLRERQTKFRRKMEFCFSSVDNMIVSIVICSVSK